MLNGYKTYLAAGAAFIIALGYSIEGYVTGSELHIEALATAFIALAILFLRKSEKTKSV